MPQNLGEHEQALQKYSRALEILGPLEHAEPPDAKVRSTAKEIRARIAAIEKLPPREGHSP